MLRLDGAPTEIPTARSPTAPTPIPHHEVRTAPFAWVDCPSGQSYLIRAGHVATVGDTAHYHAEVPRNARRENGMVVTVIEETRRVGAIVVNDRRAQPQSGTAPPASPPSTRRQIGVFS